MKRKPSTAKLMGRHISRSTWHNTTAEKSILPGTRSTAGSVVDSLPCGVVWGAVLQVSGSGFQVFKMFVDWLAPVGLLGFGMALALNRFRQWKHLMPIRYQIAIRVPRHWQLSRTRFAFVMRSLLWESAVNSWDRVSMAPHSQSYGAVASPQNHTGTATAVSHAGFDRGERETTASLSLSLALNKLVNDVSWSPPAHDPVGRVDMCMWRIGSNDCAHFHADLSPFFSDHCGPIRSNPIWSKSWKPGRTGTVLEEIYIRGRRSSSIIACLLHSFVD